MDGEQSKLTAPAFDRCLLLALIYPLVVITSIWAITGEVGPAEAALGLNLAPPWRRVVSMFAIVFLIFALERVLRDKGMRRWMWIIAGFAVACFIMLFTNWAFSLGLAVAMLCFLVAYSGDAFSGSGAVASILVIDVATDIPSIFSSAFGFAFSMAVSVAASICFVVAVIHLNLKFKERSHQSIFIFLSLSFTFLICFAAPIFLSRLPTWSKSGASLLFLNLFTLLNAPFDWLSLGLTRALMRRGLEREKWWPYLYAVVDALLASAIIAALAMAMVAGVQLFDDLAALNGGEPIFPSVREFLNAMSEHPGKPEYWWVYATLFSTMLPSLTNLFIAGISLARGVPGIQSWLLDKVRERERRSPPTIACLLRLY